MDDVQLAKKAAHSFPHPAEVLGHAWEGVHNAEKHYDPSRGVAWPVYAVFCARRRILSSLKTPSAPTTGLCLDVVSPPLYHEDEDQLLAKLLHRVKNPTHYLVAVSRWGDCLSLQAIADAHRLSRGHVCRILKKVRESL